MSPTAGNINTVGAGSITIVGNPGSSTLTTQLTGLTAHNVLVGAGTETITNISPSTAGFVLTSNGVAADPSFQAVSASGAITSITGNTGGAEVPLAGNFNILGTGSITVAGSANTETVQLTGLTNHAVLVGAGSATITKVGPTATSGQILQSAGSSADPAFSTATYPATATGTGTILRADGTNWSATTATYPTTTTINQLLYSSSANVIGGLATANQGVLTTGLTGIPVITALATNGQLIIGSTAGVPAAATLTPGTGISIANGSNSITISSTGGGVTWSDQSGAFAAVASNGYFITNTSTATLPASPSEGDTIAFIVDTDAILTIQANAGQLIRVGTTISASAGTSVSNFRGDSITLVYRATGTTWFSLGAPEGIWTTT